jgi:hypothetical protein
MTSARSRRTRVSFDSGGVRLVGYVHRPAAAGGALRDPVRRQVVADQIEFLRAHLGERARSGAASPAVGRRTS